MNKKINAFFKIYVDLRVNERVDLYNKKKV